MSLREVFEALEYGCKVSKGFNPLFSEARGQKWNEIRTNPFYTEMINELLVEADKFLTQPIKSLPFSLYKLYEQTGIRKSFEKEYFEHRSRLNVFALLSLIYSDKKYIEALEDIIWAICDEYTWCIPAHLSDNSMSIIDNINGVETSNGDIKANIRQHKKSVDLFASETGFALAETLSILEDKISPLVVYRAREEIKQRILEPYCELNSFFKWEIRDTNWSAVCAGSVGAAALYIIKDNRTLAPIINRVIESMECFLDGYNDDGACREGLSYWNYGFGFFVSFASLIKQRTAGKIDFFSNEKVKKISLFQQMCYMSENKVISFADSGQTSNFKMGLTHFLKGLYDEVEVPEIKYRVHFTGDPNYRMSHNIRNFVWSNSKYEGIKFGEAVYYLKDSQLFISRNVKDDRLTCFVVKGGDNAEPHNHNDIGSFIFHVNGETLLTDVGRGDYSKQYFGPKRYSQFYCGSHGHSVPIINGCYQIEGREFEAENFKVENTLERDIVSIDIANAYKVDSLSLLNRKFTFDKGDEAKLILQDNYKFHSKPQSVIERFVTFYEPKNNGIGNIRLSGKKGSVDIIFDPDKLKCTIQKHDLPKHKGGVYTIDLEAKVMSTELEIKVVFMVCSDGR